uniref:Uncharacterized protein n=1 Tax=Arundo donax TaxID=35708 RepID=A0A0A9FES6_ARUDO
MVIPVILEPVHVTPCQSSPQGSPPFAVHPGRVGDPSATYNPFIAETSAASVTAHTSLGAAANATSTTASRSATPPPRPGARRIAPDRPITPSDVHGRETPTARTWAPRPPVRSEPPGRRVEAAAARPDPPREKQCWGCARGTEARWGGGGGVDGSDEAGAEAEVDGGGSMGDSGGE